MDSSLDFEGVSNIEEIEVRLKIRDRVWEGKLHLRVAGQPLPDQKQPVFPSSVSELLTIIDAGNSWEIRPRQFLGADIFSEVARVVREMHGEYVSAGKASHFRIPK